MTNPTPLAQRFADCINELWRVVAGHQGGGVHPQRMDPLVINLVYRHLRAIALKFSALCARAAAGTLRRPASPNPKPDVPKPRQPRPKAAASRFPHRLPGIHAWLCTLSNPAYHTNIAAGWFERLFQDEEMRALYTQAPQLRRLLRPICTMLGIDPPLPVEWPSEENGEADAKPPPRRPRARPFWRVDPDRPSYPGAIVPPLRFRIA